EVIETDKEIIERLSEEIIELKNVNNTLLSRKDYLENKQNELEEILDELGVGDGYEGFVDFIKFLYEYKNEFKEFINMKKNNIKYDINDKIQTAVDDPLLNQKKEFDDKLAKLESN
ncbi:hypothetical protein CU098_008430, partial [Rhizopus stolonifer]